MSSDTTPHQRGGAMIDYEGLPHGDALAVYKDVCEQARAEYEAARDRALTEYEAVRAQAWEAYCRALVRALRAEGAT